MVENTDTLNEPKKIGLDIEKIVGYITLLAMFLTIILYLFSLKDDICGVKERTRAVEVKVEVLEKK